MDPEVFLKNQKTGSKLEAQRKYFIEYVKGVKKTTETNIAFRNVLPVLPKKEKETKKESPSTSASKKEKKVKEEVGSYAVETKPSTKNQCQHSVQLRRREKNRSSPKKLAKN